MKVIPFFNLEAVVEVQEITLGVLSHALRYCMIRKDHEAVNLISSLMDSLTLEEVEKEILRIKE